MSPHRVNLIRKRRSDDESSDSDEDFSPPVKKQRPCNGETNFKNALNSKWMSFISKLPVSRYFKMSFLKQASVEVIDIGDELKKEIEDEITVIQNESDPEIIPEQKYAGDKNGQRSFLHSGGTNGFPKPKLASTPFYTDGTLVGLRGVPSKKPHGFYSKAPPKSASSQRPKQVMDPTKKPLSNPKLDADILLGPSQISPEDSDDLKIVAEMSRRNRPTSAFREDVPSTSDLSERRVSLQSPSPSNLFSSGTCHEVVRLQEKATYKLLLDELLFKSQYRPVKTKEAATIEVDLTREEDEEFVMKSHYTKEMLRKPVEDFLKKYKPCQLVKRTSVPTTSNESVSKVIPPDLPKFRPRPKIEKTSALFSDDWVKEMRRSVNEETEKRLRLVSQQEDIQKRFRERREAKLQEVKRQYDKFKVPGDVCPEFLGDRDDYPDLTPEMESIVSSALQKYGVNENEELCAFNGVKISRKMMITLNEGVWLMDEVINFFFQLLVERSKLDNYPSVYAMTTFFYSSLQKGYDKVIRWTRRVDIFSYDLILIPLHLHMHWALVVVDNRTKSIKYFDSMWSGSENSLFTIQNYLVAEMKSKKNIDMDPNEYSLERVKDIPQQMNGSDCGMFTIRYAEYLSRDAPITFKQAHMSYFRRRTAYEILTKKLF